MDCAIAHGSVGREVVNEVLHPGGVGVALGRQIISTPHPSPLPVRGGEGEEAHVVVLAEPVGVVEGRAIPKFEV